MSDYIVTAQVGTNDKIFPDILRLYVPEGSRVIDFTWGRGIFWKQVDESKYDLVKNDFAKECGEYSDDFRETRWDDDEFDAVVMDPPYLYTGGWKTLRGYFHETTHGWSNSSYGNKERSERGISGVDAVDQMYYDGMMEAWRILKHKGMLIIKCMDQVMSGRQVWAHMTYHDMAEVIGFRAEDLFVVVRESRPLMRHKPENQRHARRNHSYFQVFKCWKRGAP